MYRQRSSNRPVIKGRVSPRRGRPSGSALGLRLLIGLGMALFALFSYYGSRDFNEVTQETQYISITEEQEIALGLQAAPEMIQMHGGLHPNQEAQAFIDDVGMLLVESSAAQETPYQYEFHLLADEQTVNAFALPGGQIFLTAALYNRLETEGQLAGVLGHEIAHVVARHSAMRIAQQQLTEGLTGAVAVASYDPENPASARTAQMALVIGNLVNMKYGREDELQSDNLGVLFMAQAGYDPRSLIAVMDILEDASGGQAPPEFLSTHPSPDNRRGRIQEAINQVFPNGVPDDLIP